jgi:LPS export ABC transporter protein LptC
MNISKRQSILLGSCLIIAFFMIGIVMLYSNNKSEETSSALELSKQDSANKVNLDVPVEWSKFKRSETKDGRKVWEVAAETGRYFPATSTAELLDSTITFFREDGNQMKVNSKRALVIFDGAAIKNAELSENVELFYNEEVKITTEKALYNPSIDEITAPGFVHIKSQSLDIQGEDLLGYLKKKQFSLRRNISSEIAPRKNTKGKG